MAEPDWKSIPEKTGGDAVHGIVRVALALKAGPLADFFAFVLRSPYERRMQEWMERCEMKLRHLADRDRDIIARLPSDEEFVSILMAATQAAARTHHGEKKRMLAAAVEKSAEGSGIAVDVRLLYIRFIDELMPSHFALLAVLAEHEKAVAKLSGYEPLRKWCAAVMEQPIEPSEFKLLCNDLQLRVLVRFSEALDDFDGLAVLNALALEDSGHGPKVVVTSLGNEFLAFVRDGPLAEQSDGS